MENKAACRWRLVNCQFTQKGAVISAHIPQELINEILVRLPVKSLLRFRCVSKSFRSIIDSPYFINLHLNTSAKNSDHLNLIFTESNNVISTNFNSAKLEASDFGNISSYEEKLDSLGRGLHIRGYCNGVFLLVISFSRLALWNPSTQKHRAIPRCPLEIRNRTCTQMPGLGYDSTRDEYKIVLIVAFEVWIFGLRSNSWRRIESGFISKRVAFASVGEFAHGDLHWLCALDGKDLNSQDIVAFDMEKEMFSLVTQPLYPTKEKFLDLHVLDGCLCISFLSDPAEEACLYVGKKDGADFTWNMLYSVTTAQLPPFLDIDGVGEGTVMGYSKEGDKIMLDFGLEYIISYDPKEKSFQKTTVRSRMSKFGFVQRCVESLVSLCDERQLRPQWKQTWSLRQLRRQWKRTIKTCSLD